MNHEEELERLITQQEEALDVLAGAGSVYAEAVRLRAEKEPAVFRRYSEQTGADGKKKFTDKQVEMFVKADLNAEGNVYANEKRAEILFKTAEGRCKGLQQMASAVQSLLKRKTAVEDQV